MGPRQEERKGMSMQEARGTCSGKWICKLRQYISLVIVPSTMVCPLTERDMELLHKVEITPALSSKMPLMRFDQAAGMWRAL